MTLKNQGLVGSVIKKDFVGLLKMKTLLEFEDIYQVGLMGLYHAVCKFKPEMGYKLSSYAYPWIKKHIQMVFYNEGFRFMRVPERLYEEFRLRDTESAGVYLDDPDTHLENMSELRVEQVYEDLDNKIMVEKILSELTEREKSIVTLRFGLNGSEKSLNDTGEELGISGERVRQLQVRTIERIRNLDWRIK